MMCMMLLWFPLLSSFCIAAATSTDDGRIIPIPSAPQYRYQSTDFVALIHFNMATFAHNADPGCDASNWDVVADYATGKTRYPATFNPKLLNTTQWMDSVTALGANIAVLTAKHGCGFLLWPTNTTFDDQTRYGYNTDFDLLQDFVDSAKAAGWGTDSTIAL
jgi:alpha-L-fucosidase